MLIAAFLAPSFSTLLRLVFRSQGFAFPGLPRLQLAMTGSSYQLSAISLQLHTDFFHFTLSFCFLIFDLPGIATPSARNDSPSSHCEARIVLAIAWGTVCRLTRGLR